MTDHDDGLKFKNANTDGQSKRVKNEIAFEESLKKYCPMDYDDLIAYLSREMHLCPDTIKYSFLKIYFRTNFIRYDSKNRIVCLNNGQSDKSEPQPQQPKLLVNKCKNCDKSIPDNTSFCGKNCIEQYKQKNGKENSSDCEPESFMDYAKRNPNRWDKQ
jgi:hypothetical protein